MWIAAAGESWSGIPCGSTPQVRPPASRRPWWVRMNSKRRAVRSACLGCSARRGEEEDIEDARLLSDSARVAQAEAERDFLIRELSRAVGLGGRDRRAGSASERARVSVTRAVRHALSRIRQHDPPLGEHLDRAIRTGIYCVYLPGSRITASWIS
jgi:hypothetical protein